MKTVLFMEQIFVVKLGYRDLIRRIHPVHAWNPFDKFRACFGNCKLRFIAVFFFANQHLIAGGAGLPLRGRQRRTAVAVGHELVKLTVPFAVAFRTGRQYTEGAAP